ncbi:MAG: phage tail tape measure protein [Bacteroidota bacterium]|nr:phage tail tape measure protein [Bacteroidota bacterium]
MDKFFKVAAYLTAVDNMSSVFASATSKSMASIEKMQKQMQVTRDGALLIGAGKKGLDLIEDTTKAYGDMQEAALKMQATIMQKGGIVDTDTYGKLFQMSEYLSEHYANNATAYLDMVRVLKSNRIDEPDILGGIGEATAKLADLFDQMNPAAIGEFAARMRNDMGVGVQDMGKMMDVIARVQNLGLGKSGEEVVSEMNEFFSKVGLGLANLHVGGLDTGKDMAALGALFMQKGISGQQTGTNFRRIFDGLRDPERIIKVNSMAAMYGKTLEFFDKSGHFKGIENFVDQLNKLKGLNPNAIAEILKPFSGRQGLSTDFLEFLANDGRAAFDTVMERMEKQATLDEKLEKIMEGLNYQKKVFDTSWNNTKAALGNTVAPLLTKLYESLNKIVVSIREFVEENPRIAQTLMQFAALGSVALILKGTSAIISTMATGMELLGINSGLALTSFSRFASNAIGFISGLSKGLLVLNGVQYIANTAFHKDYGLLEVAWKIVEPIAKAAALLDYGAQGLASLAGLSDGGSPIANWIDRVNADFSSSHSPYLPANPVSNGSGQIVYSPSITINGTSGNSVQELHTVMNDKMKEFDRMMKEYQSQRSRKGF